MSKVIYKTTWQEAQRLLLDNAEFVNDTELQSNRLMFCFYLLEALFYRYG